MKKLLATLLASSMALTAIGGLVDAVETTNPAADMMIRLIRRLREHGQLPKKLIGLRLRSSITITRHGAMTQALRLSPKISSSNRIPIIMICIK